MPFSMAKNGFCMWISAYPFVQNDVFSMFRSSCVYEILLTPNSPRNKNLKFLNPYLLYKMVFLDLQNSVVSLKHKEKNFFSTLNLIILQMIWNECVRFGAHLNIQVNYKILQLEVQKKASILYNLPCFQEGLFWAQHPLHSLAPLLSNSDLDVN
jgi:hypothetical protein